MGSLQPGLSEANGWFMGVLLGVLMGRHTGGPAIGYAWAMVGLM